MRERAKTPWPSTGALWSLFWRSVVWTPFALVAGTVGLLTWPLLILLPICEVLYLFSRDWRTAAIIAPVWLTLFLFARSKWFKASRRDFPNEQENV